MAGSIFKSFSLYTIGQFLTQALSFILLPFYINKLSQEEYGIVAFFMAFGFLLNAVMQYGFGAAVMRYYFDFKDNPKEFKSYLSSLVLFMIFGNGLIFIIVSLFQNEIFGLLGTSIDQGLYIYFILGYSIMFTFPLLTLTLFRVQDKPQKYLLFNIVQFLISFIFIYYFVVQLEAGALGKIKGEFWSRLPLFVVSLFIYKKYFTLKGLKKEYLKKALKFGLPMMFQAILWWGLYRMDFFLIENALGSSELGLYNVAFQVSFALITIGISFSLAWTPHFFSTAQKEGAAKTYGNLLGNFSMLLMFAASSILFFGKPILELIGGHNYLEIFKFLPWLLFGAIFQSLYYLTNQTIQYSKNTLPIPIILLLGLVLGFVAEYLLVSKYGLLGISVVKFFTFAFILSVTFVVGQKHYKIDLPYSKFMIALFLMGVNYLVTYLLVDNIWFVVLKILILIFNIVLIWYLLPFFDDGERKFILEKLGRT